MLTADELFNDEAEGLTAEEKHADEAEELTAEESHTGEAEELTAEELLILFCFSIYIYAAFQLHEQHDKSVTGYGVILPERFEETPSLWRQWSCPLCGLHSRHSLLRHH